MNPNQIQHETTNVSQGYVFTFGGGATTGVAAPLADVSDSLLLLIISATGLIVATFGFGFAVWDGNRKFKLAKEQLRIQREESEVAMKKHRRALEIMEHD